VAQTIDCQDEYITFTEKKVAQTFGILWYFFSKKLTKENINKILVTLSVTKIFLSWGWKILRPTKNLTSCA
jgi:hypothetical protein